MVDLECHDLAEFRRSRAVDGRRHRLGKLARMRDVHGPYCSDTDYRFTKRDLAHAKRSRVPGSHGLSARDHRSLRVVRDDGQAGRGYFQR